MGGTILIVFLVMLLHISQGVVVVKDKPSETSIHRTIVIADPTLGYLENKTQNWILEVVIDDQEMTLVPGRKQKVCLDIGTHFVEVTAYVDTKHYGRKYVGYLEREIGVDGKMRYGGYHKHRIYGWRLVLFERLFVMR